MFDEAKVDGNQQNSSDNQDTQGAPEKSYDELKTEYDGLKLEVERLKGHTDTLVAEAKERKEKLKDAQTRADKEAREKLEKEGNYKQLLESSEAEKRQLAEEVSQLKQADKTRELETQAMDIATKLATSSLKRANVLKDIVKNQIKIVDGEVKILDSKGNLTVSTVDDLMNNIKKEYDFLCDGLNSSGGAGAVAKETPYKETNVKQDPIDKLNSIFGTP